MKYLVLEIQTFEGGTVSTPAYAYDDVNAAWAKYYSILASAAVSKLPLHTAVLMDNHGVVLDGRFFEHVTEGEA